MSDMLIYTVFVIKEENHVIYTINAQVFDISRQFNDSVLICLY